MLPTGIDGEGWEAEIIEKELSASKRDYCGE